MATIDRMTVNGASYDIMDSQAKTAIEIVDGSARLNYVAPLNGTTIDQNGVTGTIAENRVRLSGTPTGNFGITIFTFKPPFAMLPDSGAFLLDVNGLNNAQIVVMIYYKDTNGTTHELYRTSFSAHGAVNLPTAEDMTELTASITVLTGSALDVDFTVRIENIINGISAESFLATGLQYDLLTNSYLSRDYYSANGVSMVKANGTYTLVGTADASNNFSLYDTAYDLLKAFVPGKTYTFHYLNPDNIPLYLQILYNTASAYNQPLYSDIESKDADFTIPADATRFFVRLTYIDGTVYNNSIELYITEKNEMSQKANKYYFTSNYGGSLLQTVTAAKKVRDSIVILDSGTYDIVQEFIDAYGESFFTNYTASQKNGWGLEIGNGMTLRAYTDAVINCDCSAYDAANVYYYFSPLMLVGDCTLENLTINATHCKYCVHDDWYVKTVKAKHEYKNCKMYHYGRGVRCIGGGLTNAMEIVIKDCYFEMDHDGTPINYHNCVNADAISRGVISGNYFKTGYVSFTNYGASTKMTQFIVSNNSFAPGSPTTIVPGFEDQEYYPNVNIEVVQFNNEVRG